MLVLLLSQVTSDGMTGVELGLRDDETYLIYRADWNDASAGSWEMVPPPREIYPALVQAIIWHTDFDPERPGNGRLAVCGIGRARVDVVIHGFDRIEIAFKG